MDVGGGGKAPARADALRLAERSGLRVKRARVVLEEICDGLAGAGAILRENDLRPSEANRIAALFDEYDQHSLEGDEARDVMAKLSKIRKLR